MLSPGSDAGMFVIDPKARFAAQDDNGGRVWDGPVRGCGEAVVRDDINSFSRTLFFATLST